MDDRNFHMRIATMKGERAYIQFVDKSRQCLWPIELLHETIEELDAMVKALFTIEDAVKEEIMAVEAKKETEKQ